MENDFSHVMRGRLPRRLRACNGSFLPVEAADCGRNQEGELFFTLRAAVQAFPGDEEVVFGLRCVLFPVSAGTAAAAQYDQQVRPRCVGRNKLDILPGGCEPADPSGQ